MTPIALNTWDPPNGGMRRIYINGHPFTKQAKLWIERSGPGKLRAVTPDRARYRDAQLAMTECFRTLAAENILPTEHPTWEDLEAAAAQQQLSAPPRPSRGNPGWRPDPRQPARYTSEHTASLDPNGMYDPLPEPTRLVIDHREPAHIIQGLQAVHNLEVEVAQLEVADYIAYRADREPALAIERKTLDDMVNSLTGQGGDLKLFRQIRDTNLPGAAAVFLIEGDPWAATRTGIPQLTGLLSYVITGLGASPFPVIDARHTIYAITKLVRHAVYGLKNPLPLRAGGPKDPREAAIFVLEGIPGISANKARALLAHFGSVAAIATATQPELQRVPGIGPTIAAQIVATLGTQHLRGT